MRGSLRKSDLEFGYCILLNFPPGSDLIRPIPLHFAILASISILPRIYPNRWNARHASSANLAYECRSHRCSELFRKASDLWLEVANGSLPVGLLKAGRLLRLYSGVPAG